MHLHTWHVSQQLTSLSHWRWQALDRHQHDSRPYLSWKQHKYRTSASGRLDTQTVSSSTTLQLPHNAAPLHPLLTQGRPKGYRCPLCFTSDHSRGQLAEHVVRRLVFVVYMSLTRRLQHKLLPHTFYNLLLTHVVIGGRLAAGTCSIGLSIRQILRCSSVLFVALPAVTDTPCACTSAMCALTSRTILCSQALFVAFHRPHLKLTRALLLCTRCEIYCLP